MATMAEISAAITLIDVKKQNLHKSFLHLQSLTPSSFNLPLKWPDLDSYFTTLHSSLQSKFNRLQTFTPPSDTTPVPARPELKSFCENSDGLGLNRFIAQSPDPVSILSELPDAYRYAPDPPAMVLDAVASFYGTEFNAVELRSYRSGCSIMLDGLIRTKPDVTIELKDKAAEMAVQWKQIRVSRPGYISTNEQEALGFLHLVGAYGLIDRFNIDGIIDCFLIVATKRHTIDLCRRIVPASNINDVIQKLIDKDMHVTAVNFIIDLQKTDEFAPVGLLEERKLRSVRVIEDARQDIKDLHVCNDVIMREIRVLNSIIKCVNENRLESEYPTDCLVELVNKLENEVENSKHAPSKSTKSKLNEDQPTAESAAKDSVVELVNNPGNEDENSKQTRVNDLGTRKQPLRAAVLKQQLLSKSKMSKKSKKRKVNQVQPTAESAVATPTRKESRSQKQDHVGECRSSPLGSAPTGSSAPSAGPIGSPYGSTQAGFDYSFYVPQLHPPSDCNSNGWISD